VVLLSANKRLIVFAVIFGAGLIILLSAAVFGRILIAGNPDLNSDAKFHAFAGDELLRQGKVFEAIGAYEKSLSLEEDLVVRSNLAVLYHQAGLYSNSISHLRALVVFEPKNPSFHYDLAVNLVERFRNTDDKMLEDLLEALGEYETANILRSGFSSAENNIKVLKKVLDEAKISY
jgi:tetratricopeptide (TPR) repeat protein